MNTALGTNDELSYIQFGRAEEAAREAQEKRFAEYEKRARQASYNSAAGAANRPASIPKASSIPNSGRVLRSAEGTLPLKPRVGAEAVTYAAPYAGAVNAAQPSMQSASVLRAQSTSAKLREKAPAAPKKQNAHKAKLCPTQFFAAVALVIGLVFALSVISAWESDIAKNLSQGTQNEYVSQSELFQKSENPLAVGDAYRACAMYFLVASAGLIACVTAWRTSNKFCVAAACACYIAAVIFRPQLLGTVIAPLVISMLSLWIMYLNGKARKRSTPHSLRNQRNPRTVREARR
ncbi:MAG: hypothetical protein LBD16_03250 [Oscillospiraceae bacterium]|jgi:hypothetical protein|nr:hypothetical protein [Oscillospiraceae bacterium]